MTSAPNIPFQDGPHGWPLLQRLIDNTQRLFGDPRDILFKPVRAGMEWTIRLLRKDLNMLAAFTRRLMLIEACALTLKPPRTFAPRPRKQKPRIVTYVIQPEPVIAFFTNKPRLSENTERWRAILHLSPANRRTRARLRAAKAAALRANPALALQTAAPARISPRSAPPHRRRSRTLRAPRCAPYPQTPAALAARKISRPRHRPRQRKNRPPRAPRRDGRHAREHELTHLSLFLPRQGRVSAARSALTGGAETLSSKV